MYDSSIIYHFILQCQHYCPTQQFAIDLDKTYRTLIYIFRMTGQQDRSEDTRHNIADGLTCVSSLVVRYLTRGPGLTSRTVMASLAENGPIRLTALARQAVSASLR